LLEEHYLFVCIYACNGFSLSFITRNSYARLMVLSLVAIAQKLRAQLGKQIMLSYVFPLQMERRSWNVRTRNFHACGKKGVELGYGG